MSFIGSRLRILVGLLSYYIDSLRIIEKLKTALTKALILTKIDYFKGAGEIILIINISLTG
jgi:hypothetical protein